MLIYFLAGSIAVAYVWFFYLLTNPALSLRQRIFCSILRFITATLLSLFLLTPIIYYIRHYTDKPLIILLKDTSASMLLKHNDQTKSSALINSYGYLKNIYKDAGYDVKEYSFADGLNGNPNTTYLIPSLEEIKKISGKSSIHRIVLFSDGWFRDTDLSLIRLFDSAINVVTDTTKQEIIDLKLSDLKHNKQGYKNELALFETHLSSSNFKGDAKVSFIINGKQVQEKNVSFLKDAVQTITFEHRFTQTGLHRLEAKISGKDLSEINLANNNYISAIDILIDKEKLLLFTDAPNWDTKFILDAIKENNRLEAISYTIKNGVLYSGDKRSTISNWDNITSFLIINNGSLSIDNTVATNIMNKVRQGTGLFYIGLPVQQLTEILPLKQSNIRTSYKGLIRFQPASASNSALRISDDELRQIPPVDYYYLNPSAQAEVLAVMDNPPKSPALAISSSGTGKVLSLAFLNLWRWQLQSKTQAYKTFISDLLAWLGNKSSGFLTATYEPSYYLDEPIRIKLTAIDETRKMRTNLSLRIAVYNAQNDSIYSEYFTGDNDEYAVEFRINKPDEYRFIISEQNSGQSTQGRFIVATGNLEERDLGYNIPLLNWIATQTGGKFYTVEDTQSLKPVRASSVKKIERRDFPLYKKWYLITLFIFVFCLELFLRRRWGLL